MFSGWKITSSKRYHARKAAARAVAVVVRVQPTAITRRLPLGYARVRLSGCSVSGLVKSWSMTQVVTITRRSWPATRPPNYLRCTSAMRINCLTTACRRRSVQPIPRLIAASPTWSSKTCRLRTTVIPCSVHRSRSRSSLPAPSAAISRPRAPSPIPSRITKSNRMAGCLCLPASIRPKCTRRPMASPGPSIRSPMPASSIHWPGAPIAG